MRSKGNKYCLFPIKTLLGFLVFTEVLYFIGPLNYPTKSPGLLLLFLIIVNISLYKGYLAGYKKRIKEENVKTSLYDPNKRIIRVFIYIALVVGLLSIANTWQLGEFSISNILGRATGGLLNPGEVYKEKTSFEETGKWGYILMILSPFPIIAKCWSIYFWQKLSKDLKLIVLIVFLLDILYWLGIGVRKGLLDMLIMFFLCIIASNYKLLQGKHLLRIVVLSVSLGIVFIIYFIYSNLSRYGLSPNEILYLTGSEYGIRPFYKNVPPVFTIVLTEVSGYLCQGYYALSCVLHDFFFEGVFFFSYGLGHNSFFLNIMDHLAPNFDIRSLTYFNYLQAKYGVDPRINWHTIYVWLANDFTIFGVIPVVYWIGSLLGKTWIDSIRKVTIYSVPLLYLVALCVFYFYANNQIFSFSFIPFWVSYMLYYYWRKKKRTIKLKNNG